MIAAGRVAVSADDLLGAARASPAMIVAIFLSPSGPFAVLQNAGRNYRRPKRIRWPPPRRKRVRSPLTKTGTLSLQPGQALGEIFHWISQRG